MTSRFDFIRIRSDFHPYLRGRLNFSFFFCVQVRRATGETTARRRLPGALAPDDPSTALPAHVHSILPPRVLTRRPCQPLDVTSTGRLPCSGQVAALLVPFRHARRLARARTKTLPPSPASPSLPLLPKSQAQRPHPRQVKSTRATSLPHLVPGRCSPRPHRTSQGTSKQSPPRQTPLASADPFRRAPRVRPSLLCPAPHASPSTFAAAAAAARRSPSWSHPWRRRSGPGRGRSWRASTR